MLPSSESISKSQIKEGKQNKISSLTINFNFFKKLETSNVKVKEKVLAEHHKVYTSHLNKDG